MRRLALTLTLGMAVIPAASQTPAQKPTFEVASIKPSPPGSNGMSIGSPAGRFIARNASLKLLVVNAFNVQNFQIEGGPSWMNSDYFDIDAKTPDNTTGKQNYEMLQTLLADRFQLKVHRETHELSIYALSVGKSGPKLNPANEDERSMVSARGRGRMEFHKISLSTLAQNLAGNMDRIVLDKTGLTGDFDFTLEWNPDIAQPDTDTSRPTIFTAIQEQLGLKLESTKGPVEVLVIDSVQRPTEN
jgi:uncharacterized protein (TIGR03435 family)